MCPAPSSSSPADALAGRLWALLLAADPVYASLLGDHRHPDRLPDLTAAWQAEHVDDLRTIASEAEALLEADLSAEDRVTAGIIAVEAPAQADLVAARLPEFTVAAAIVGPQATLLEVCPLLTLPGADEAEGLVARYRAADRYLAEAAERLREGVSRGRTPPRHAVEITVAALDAYLQTSIGDDPLLGPAPPPTWSDVEAQAWRERMVEAVRDVVRPGVLAYREALATEVAPHARPDERSGLVWLPDGEEVYRASIRRYASLPLDPDAVHAMGMDEITSLAEEYARLGQRALGTSDVGAVHVRLREDPDLRFSTAEEVLEQAQRALDRANAAVPSWFGTLPATPCVVAEMSPHEAPTGTIAYYMPPAGDGSRPGTYLVNTSEPTTRTRFESEALAFHEAVPGHHLQIALAQELAGLPALRRNLLVNAYVEGWALYTERLADEMGLYSGDVARLGMLSFDSWRACRLVVDTGMHHLGWSRQRAIDFMTEHSPQAANNIRNEVDRYISWPAQALGYKVGQRAIVGLRRRAEQTLGAAFDVRRFHDAVLEHGAVPLPTLEAIVDTWIASVPR